MGEDFHLEMAYEDRYTSQHDPLDDECWDVFDPWEDREWEADNLELDSVDPWEYDEFNADSYLDQFATYLRSNA